jgi:hypothetical protein
VTRKKIERYIWLNNFPLPKEICEIDSRYGFYRVLNNGKFEFVSACDPRAKQWVSMNKDDLKRLLNEKTRTRENKKSH